jgi:hypothetical protein
MEPLVSLRAAGLSQSDIDTIADGNPRRAFNRLN